MSGLGKSSSFKCLRMAVGAAVLAAMATSCSAGGAKPVVVGTARTAMVDASPSGFGQVSAAVDLPILSGFSATIASVAVQPGERVVKGQTLLTVNPVTSPTAVRQAQTHILGDIAAQKAAGAAVANPQTRRSPLTLDAAQARLSAANARLALDTQLLAIAAGASTTVTSPIDGVVANVNVQPGVYIGRSKPAIEIVDFSHVLINVNLPVDDQSLVQPGQSAETTFTELPGVTLTGTVVSVAPDAVDNGQSFQLTVDAPNTKTGQVRPGFIAYIRVHVKRRAAVAVPTLCVLNKNTDPTVFVIDADVARLRHVTLGASDAHSVEVLSGLRDGERCVIAGNQQLSDGTRVRVSS